MPYLLGIDIGTYSSKGVLTTDLGEVVANKTVEHGLNMPHPGYAEHDAERVWWHDFTSICHYLLSETGIHPQEILGVGVSSIAPAIVPLNAAGQPLRPAILYGIDTRASAEIRELEEKLGTAVIRERTGGSLSSQSAVPKILWIRRNEPEVWAETKHILGGHGYVVFRLTGEHTLDVYDATGYAPFFNLQTCRWDDLFEEYIAPRDMLPRLTWSCGVAGTVTSEAALQTGLAVGTPVITGAADAAAEAVSAGLSSPGDMMVMYGSSIFFILRTDSLRLSTTFWGCPFLEPRTYVIAGGMSTAGSLTRWFRDEFAPLEAAAEREGGKNAYEALAHLAASSPPGANGLVALPYFAGERTPLHDPDAKGMLAGLTLRHTRADVYRALLESVGYGIRHNLQVMREEGIMAERVLAVGGGTLNREWMQIVSDIADIEQHIPEQQVGAAYGDAFLAGVGVGLFNSVGEIAKWVRVTDAIRPDASRHRMYSDYYEIYRGLYVNNQDGMRQLGRIETNRVS